MSAFLTLSRGALLGLAAALDQGKLSPPCSALSLAHHVPPEAREATREELNRLHASGATPAHIGYTLALLAQAREAEQRQRERLSVVWTGPSTTGHACRDAATVARELVKGATSEILLASYVIDTAKKTPKEAHKALLKPLAVRMDALPHLRVRLFINIPRPWHHNQLDGRPSEALLREFTRDLVDRWPGARLPEVFYDPRALSMQRGPRACMHAKVVIADRRRALVTSANLTEAAHERNIEAGVLIDDPMVAQDLERPFLALVEEGALLPLTLP